MEIKDIENALEGILFAAGDPVSVEKLSSVLDVDKSTLEMIFKNLSDYYRFNRRGIRLIRLEDSYQMVTGAEYSEVIKEVLNSKKPPQISRAALEVLSIIAYYQPTTRAYIEQIRGVDSYGSVGTLLDRGLIEECGTLDVPGRPHLLRTTPGFLRAFGISSIDDLPQLEDPNGIAEGQIALDEYSVEDSTE